MVEALASLRESQGPAYGTVLEPGLFLILCEWTGPTATPPAEPHLGSAQISGQDEGSITQVSRYQWNTTICLAPGKHHGDAKTL